MVWIFSGFWYRWCFCEAGQKEPAFSTVQERSFPPHGPHRMDLALINLQKSCNSVDTVYNILDQIWKTFHVSPKSAQELQEQILYMKALRATFSELQESCRAVNTFLKNSITTVNRQDLFYLARDYQLTRFTIVLCNAESRRITYSTNKTLSQRISICLNRTTNIPDIWRL